MCARQAGDGRHRPGVFLAALVTSGCAIGGVATALSGAGTLSCV